MRKTAWLRLAITASLAGFIVLACAGGGMASRPADREPTEPEFPSLLGTWQQTKADDDGAVSHHEMLTFTADGRAIRVTHRARTADGTVLDVWSLPGGWSDQTATTVTRLFFEDHTDDDERNPEHGSVMKNYTLTGDMLTLDNWREPEPTDRVEHWQRVPADTLPQLFGTWHYPNPRDPGGFTLTVELDGAFTLREDRLHDPDHNDVRELAGVGVLDLPNYAINLRDLTVTTYDDAGAALYGPAPYEFGETGRAAFAPFFDGFAVSPPRNENEPETEPYGAYWMFFTRLDDDG